MLSDSAIVSVERRHLPGVIERFAGEHWSYADDEQRTWRALTAPGSLSLVALSPERTVIGIAQILSDGEVCRRHLAVFVSPASTAVRGSSALCYPERRPTPFFAIHAVGSCSEDGLNVEICE